MTRLTAFFWLTRSRWHCEALRVFVTPRLAIRPEIAYLSGEFDELDTSSISVTGNITFDFVRDDRRARFIPYVAAGSGYVRQKTLVGSGPPSTALVPFTSSEGTVSGFIDRTRRGWTTLQIATGGC